MPDPVGGPLFDEGHYAGAGDAVSPIGVGPLSSRGRLRLCDVRLDNLAGGSFAGEFATTDTAPKIAGDVVVVDQYGNFIDSGVLLSALQALIATGATHTEVLTDSSGPILTSTGDLIYVSGVPN